MSEADPNAVAWAKEASPLAIQAVSQAEDVARTISSAAEAIARAADRQPDGSSKTPRQFEDASRHPADGNTDQVHALLSLASTSLGGLEDLQQCLSGLVESVIRTNLRLAQEMFLVESPRALAELQLRFLHEYFDAMQQGAAVLIRATRRPEEQAEALQAN